MSPLGIAVVVVALSADPELQARLATPATLQQARMAVERGLVFLQEDAVKWRTEHECASCHHGAMTVWGFTEAQNRGYAVGAEPLVGIARLLARQNSDGGWSQEARRK